MFKLITKNIVNKKSIFKFINIYDLYNLKYGIKYIDESNNPIYKGILFEKISNVIVDSSYNNETFDHNFSKYIEFNILLQAYFDYNNIYNYLPKIVFHNLINKILKNLRDLVISNFNFIKYFEYNYKKILKFQELISYNPDYEILEILMYYKSKNFNDLFEYVSLLCKSINSNNKDYYISDYIQLNKHLVQLSDLNDMVIIIDNNIKNKKSNETCYKFIKYLKLNKDYILSTLKILLMKRYIYDKNFDKYYENKEYEVMLKYFNKNELYKFNKIIQDINKLDNQIDIFGIQTSKPDMSLYLLHKILKIILSNMYLNMSGN